MFKKIFSKWNKIDRCPKCGCRSTTEHPLDYINYMVCESEIRCTNCNELLDFWAYGSSQAIRTRTGQLHYIWSGKNPFYQKFFGSFVVIFGQKDIWLP